MKSREETVAKIFREYEKMRDHAERKRDRYVDEIYKAYPRLKEISYEINCLGFENIRKIMANPEKGKEFNERFQKELKKLDDEQKQIIKDNNIPPDYKEPVYECKICGDTGFNGNEKCECYKKKMIEYEYENSNLSILVKEDTFDKFNFDYYRDEMIPNQRITYRKNIENIYRDALKFCDEFENERKNLIMIGAAGLGKTFVSNCIANEILKKGYSVSYVRSTSMFSSYENYKFSKDKRITVDIEWLYECDLLIIDDFGTESYSKAGVSFFFDLLNERIDKGKKIIINSNLGLKEISENYSSRVTSRIYEYFEIFHFYGDDIRIQKLKKGAVAK